MNRKICNKLRRLELEAMTKYFKQLCTKAKVVDSVVRKRLLLSKQEYVLEQTVSIEVGPPGDNWRAIIWLDSGRDLSQSVRGPWNPQPGTRARETYSFQRLQTKPPISLLDQKASQHYNRSLPAQITRAGQTQSQKKIGGQRKTLTCFRFNMDHVLIKAWLFGTCYTP